MNEVRTSSSAEPAITARTIARSASAAATDGRGPAPRSILHLEHDLGDDARVERKVVGGDELHAQHVQAGLDGRELGAGGEFIHSI